MVTGSAVLMVCGILLPDNKLSVVSGLLLNEAVIFNSTTMTKKKTTRRATAAAKEEVAKAKIEATDVLKENAVDDMAKDTKSAAHMATKTAKRCCGAKRRSWIIVLVIIAALVVGYQYVAKNTTLLSGVMGGIHVGEKVDATDAKQWGYAVGAIIGKQVMQMVEQAPGREDMDMSMFMRGLNDAVRKVEKPLLSEEQVQSLLEDRMQMEQDKLVAEAKANKEKSDAFVADYAKKDGVKKLDGGTLYSVKKSGTGARVGDRDVQVRYVGKHISGKEFDSSQRNGNDKPAVLNAKQTVPGFGAALRAMRVGDKWEVVIPADQAYGEQGVPPAGIAPNEALVFEVEVVGLDQ